MNNEQIKSLIAKTLEDDQLYHFGVKGMKWGVRKDSKIVGTSKSKKKLDSSNVKSTKGKGSLSKKDKKKSEGSQDYLNAKKISRKRPRNMSNNEIRQVLERQRLTKELKQSKKRVSGAKTVAKVLAVANTAQKVNKIIKSDVGKDVSRYATNVYHFLYGLR